MILFPLLLSPAPLSHPLLPPSVIKPSATPTTNSTTNTSSPVTHGSNPPAMKSRVPHTLGTVRVQWDEKKPCQGRMIFSWNFTDGPKLASFRNTSIKNDLGREMCRDRVCGAFVGFIIVTDTIDCFIIEENLAVTPGRCKSETLVCKERLRIGRRCYSLHLLITYNLFH